MRQANWKNVEDSGDADGIDVGMWNVYEDESGESAPELEVLDVYAQTAGVHYWAVSRIPLERCKLSPQGRLIPFAYDPSWPHPVESYVEWFDAHIESVCASIGMDAEDLRAKLCSESTLDRAEGYRALVEHLGAIEFDQYPLTYFDRAEVLRRYGQASD